MAIINIARGPWSINNALITSTVRLPNGNVQVIANGISYELTVAEAITLLTITIPQIPPLIPNTSSGAIFPNANIMVMGVQATDGRLVISAWGVAVNDAGIVAQVGADALYADGSTYQSCLAGAGTFWVKKNDVWTNAV